MRKITLHHLNTCSSIAQRLAIEVLVAASTLFNSRQYTDKDD